MSHLVAESLFQELQRRNVFKVGTAYIILAWVVIQVTDQAVPALLLPEWVNSFVFYIGLIGFPFVLLFAWAFELTPEGIKPESAVDRTESITSDTGKKINAITFGLLAIALGYFVYESRFMDRSDTESSEVTQVTQSDQSSEQLATETPSSEVKPVGSSIAVLPFVNMSSDEEQEFFSDGISEEILNVLAKIPNLHVTSRSSAFAFKGKEINISEVAEKLGVANILEGSVRKAGNKVRITAQLIEAETDKHLWSETYDRELDDIFAIQDEISNAIVMALKEKLALDEITIDTSTVVDISAHEAFLRGRFLLQKRNQADLERALVELDKAIAIEPGYAEAWMGKAWVIHYLNELNYGDIPLAIASERAQSALDRAKILKPDMPENYGIQGLIYSEMGNIDGALEAYQKAIELNPNYSLAHVWYGNELLNNPTKQIEMYARAYRLDPINMLAANNYTLVLTSTGQYDRALEIADKIAELQPNHLFASRSRSLILMDMGRYGEGVYYSHKTYAKNNSLLYLLSVRTGLANLGLLDQLVELLVDTELAASRHIYSGNSELFISETLAKYPRAENDYMGNLRAGFAHYENQNFKAAIENFSKAPLCQQVCFEIIDSYRLLGDQEGYEEALQSFQRGADLRVQAGYQSTFDVNEYIKLALYSRNMDRAIELFEQNLAKGRPIDFFYLRSAWFNEELHAHPKWPELVAQSKVISEREKQVYLDMLAAEPIL